MPRWIVPSLALLIGCERLPVNVVRVDRGPVESTVTSVEAGVVEPLEKASLASPVSGRIVRVHKREGDRVAAGEAIVELENELEKIRVEEAALELKRLQDLKDVDTSEHRLNLAEFAHRRARADYERTIIRATFPGIVAELNARLGEMTFGAMAGFSLTRGPEGDDSRLVYIVDDSQLFVEAQIDESDVFRVKVGQPVKVSLGGIDRRVVRGRTVSISPTVSTQEGESRTAEVKVELLEGAYPPPENGGARSGGDIAPAAHTEPPAAITIGMSADIEILVDRVEDAVRVPTPALLERGADKYVYLVREDRLVRRQVTVGIGNWDRHQVLSGVEPGDLIVLPTDASQLREGVLVAATVEEAQEAGK
jgi:HlyD family secretion protein